MNTKLEENITTNYFKHLWLYSIFEETITNNHNYDNCRNCINDKIFEEVIFNSIKMDNISVNIVLKVVNNHFIVLDIQSDRMFNCKSEEITSYFYKNIIVKSIDHLTFSDFIIAFLKIERIIRTHKFNKYIGEFINMNTSCSYRVRLVAKHKAINKITHNNDNISLNNNTCVVCYDPTLTLTPCNHNVCYVCLNTIAQNIDMNHEELSPIEQIIPCPICRKDINGNETS